MIGAHVYKFSTCNKEISSGSWEAVLFVLVLADDS